MSNDEKVRENRLRRAATRQRVTLTKRRRLDPRAWDYGRFDLHGPDGTRLNDDNGLTLEQVEARLLGDPEDDSDDAGQAELVGAHAG